MCKLWKISRESLSCGRGIPKTNRPIIETFSSRGHGGAGVKINPANAATENPSLWPGSRVGKAIGGQWRNLRSKFRGAKF